MDTNPLKIFLLAFALFCFFIIEISFLPFFQIFKQGIDLLFIVFFAIAFFQKMSKKAIYILAIFTGFLFDAYFALPFFGAFTFTFVLIVWLINKIKQITHQTGLMALGFAFLIAFLIFKLLPFIIISLFISFENKKLIYWGHFSLMGIALDFIVGIFILSLYAIFCKKIVQRN